MCEHGSRVEPGVAGRNRRGGGAGQPDGWRWRVVLAVAAGGAVGASLRYGFDRAFPTDPGAFPWTTFSENALGAFALGLAMVLITERLHSVRYLQPVLCTGVLGSFTTFSNMSVEAVGLVEAGRWSLGLVYLGGSVAAGLAAGLAGMAGARWLNRRAERSLWKERT